MFKIKIRSLPLDRIFHSMVYHVTLNYIINGSALAPLSSQTITELGSYIPLKECVCGSSNCRVLRLELKFSFKVLLSPTTTTTTKPPDGRYIMLIPLVKKKTPPTEHNIAEITHTFFHALYFCVCTKPTTCENNTYALVSHVT